MTELGTPPPPKRAKLAPHTTSNERDSACNLRPQLTPETTTAGHIDIAGENVRKKVFSCTELITNYLKPWHILCQSLPESTDFLKREEERKIWKLCDENYSDRYLSARMLSFLKDRDDEEGDIDCLKFVACIIKATEHLGHVDIVESLRETLGLKVWLWIYDNILHEENDSLDRPRPLISLKGKIIGEKFLDIEKKMWFSFNKGDYETVETHIREVTTSTFEGHKVFNYDCHVAVLCFRAVILVHRDGKHEQAITLLTYAESLIKNSKNESILKGRIYQRMSQIYLTMQNSDVSKELAKVYFERAKHELQFVGRGLEKAKILCREAKLLTATAMSDCDLDYKRLNDIEKMYEKALSTMEKDDPYFLVCFASVILSKAAFHLHASFSGVLPDNCPLHTVSSEDIKKAKDTLKGFSAEEHILVEMRRKEYDFLQAELCRLDGNLEEARERFKAMVNGKDKKAKNIVSLVKHRLNYIGYSDTTFKLVQNEEMSFITIATQMLSCTCM